MTEFLAIPLASSACSVEPRADGERDLAPCVTFGDVDLTLEEESITSEPDRPYGAGDLRGCEEARTSRSHTLEELRARRTGPLLPATSGATVEELSMAAKKNSLTSLNKTLFVSQT